MEHDGSAPVFEKTQVRSTHESRRTGQPTSHLATQPLTKAAKAKRFLCSLSTLVALVYFALLSITAIITVSVTRIQTGKDIFLLWSSTHATHIKIVESAVNNVISLTAGSCRTSASLFAQLPYPVESNTTLTMLCAELDIADPNNRMRALGMLSFARNEFAVCAHGDPTDPTLATLAAILSNKGHFYGAYYINRTTYTFDDPPLLKTPMSSSITPKLFLDMYQETLPTIDKVLAFHNGTGPPLSSADLWSQPASQPNRYYYSLPLLWLGADVPLSPSVQPTDFTQMRIDAGTLLDTDLLTDPLVAFRAMALINQSLGTDEPLVLSNSWKQQVVFNPTDVLNYTTSTTYLSTRHITDPLMRKALKYIDLKQLQSSKNQPTNANFDYRGAPARATAFIYETAFGLSVPLIVVSPNSAVAGPYMTIKKACTALVVVAILLATAIFYFAIDRYLSRPLREVTAAMEASVERGVRQPVRGAACDVVQLAETRELACAYNAAMAQLRVVDAFVPDAVRATRRGGPSLREHYLTVVTVRVRAGSGAGGAGGAAYGGDVGVDTSALLRRHPGAGAGAGAGGGGVSGDRGRRGGGGLAALVNAVAEAATALTNSGPFASAASLSAFVAAVRELCEARGGTVHRAAPDECVLHFAANVRRVLSGSGAGSGGGAGAGAAATGDRSLAAAVERAADADARAGVECALCVSRWVEHQQQQQEERGNSNSNGDCVEAVPDVRVVVDSGVFVCGEYRAPGSEQTLCVALGRDVAGAVGHVPAAIGVRVAATGEAALRVRDGAGGSAGGGTTAAAAACSSPPPFPPAAAERGGFRVLPVEALRTGRAGLDGGAVTLYEVLPGAVDGDAAWLAYARCCDDGFECMVRGDYAGALRAYRGVGEIGDLEPGLLPRCLSREAAHSDAVGGAVSVQVARLMRECERRVRAGSTAGYERRRHVPLGMDAVLGMAAGRMSDSSMGVMSTASRCHQKSTCGSSVLSALSRQGRVVERRRLSVWRYVVTVNTTDGCVRRAIGGIPPRLRDNNGLTWRFPRSLEKTAGSELVGHHYLSLGVTGTLCTLTTLVLREGAGMFPSVMSAAPDGPMPDALRSALPIWLPSPALHITLGRICRARAALTHPSLLQCLSYSVDVEGCVVVFWEYFCGSTMRDVVQRYSRLSRKTLLRFAYPIVSVLSFLHARGFTNGFLSQDTVIVGADGVCRVMNLIADHVIETKVFARPRSCYVSPQMAAGNPPTPACDMFCYGLLCLEAVSRQPAWTWATVPEGSAPHGTQEKLKTLMAEGGQAFSAAVVDGRVVPNMAVLYCADMSRYDAVGKETMEKLLSYDPMQRPTADSLVLTYMTFLGEAGVKFAV